MKLKHMLAAALVAGAVAPVSASVFDFSNLQFNGSSNSGFLPTDGVACTGGDLCSSNVDGGVRNGDLTFVSGGLTAKAMATWNGGAAAVVQDHENAYNPAQNIGAGLGVYHQSGNSSDDNVTVGESLKLSFPQIVTLTDLELRSDGHDSSWASGATFLLNGVSKALAASIPLNLTGQYFTFCFGGTLPDQFYLAGVTATRVPEPMTPALVLAGLGALGLVSRRRAKAASA